MPEALTRIPTHAAIIVDGNRRWAKNRGLPASFGHKAGFDRLKEITRYAVGDCGIKVLSLYVFSTENFARDAKEVGYLMDLFANNFRTIAEEMNERDCQVLFSGRREGLQQRVLDAMDYMMDLTKDNDKGIVNFCLNYGSHAELTDAMRETLQAYPVGGICQFGKNITDPEQLAQFNADLQAASRTPLFIAVDEEGGAVARLANHPAFDLPQYESAAAVGASGDPADACAMGQTIGAYLKEYGFNMDFAPDADVNTNPDNPIIGTRAFSSDAATAAEMAAAAADGLRTSGILPTLKHFPGHGDTAEDSHTALAVTYKTLDELQACELLPFAAYTGLHAVMVGHIAAPNVTGDGTPATLSPQLVALIPDAENTLIVTDSLAMDAITAAYTPGEAAVQALQAGCDVLLMPNSLPEAYAAVLEAVQNGTISEERLDRSVNKILLYKQQFAS